MVLKIDGFSIAILIRDVIIKNLIKYKPFGLSA